MCRSNHLNRFAENKSQNEENNGPRTKPERSSEYVAIPEGSLKNEDGSASSHPQRPRRGAAEGVGSGRGRKDRQRSPATGERSRESEASFSSLTTSHHNGLGRRRVAGAGGGQRGGDNNAKFCEAPVAGALPSIRTRTCAPPWRRESLGSES